MYISPTRSVGWSSDCIASVVAWIEQGEMRDNIGEIDGTKKIYGKGGRSVCMYQGMEKRRSK